MAETRLRETVSDTILQKIDGLSQHVMVIRDTPSAAALSYRGNAPFWLTDLYALSPPDMRDPAGETLLLTELGDCRLRLSRRSEPMPHTRRHIDADNVYFIHRGAVRFETELGDIDAEAGRFVFIGRGVGHRIVPKGSDLVALVLESDVAMKVSGVMRKAEVLLVVPTRTAPTERSTGRWEERLITRDWVAVVEHDYDPIRISQIVGHADFVFAVDLDAVPVFIPGSPIPGLPFTVFENARLTWEVTKRPGALPFYHRNMRETELEFCHSGCADQDTELGFVAAPPGHLYNLPLGIEHAPCNRNGDPPPVNLIWSVRGPVHINDAIPVRPASALAAGQAVR